MRDDDVYPLRRSQSPFCRVVEHSDYFVRPDSGGVHDDFCSDFERVLSDRVFNRQSGDIAAVFQHRDRSRVVCNQRALSRSFFYHFDDQSRVVGQAVVVDETASQTLQLQARGKGDTLRALEPEVTSQILATREQIVDCQAYAQLQFVRAQRGARRWLVDRNNKRKLAREVWGHSLKYRSFE